MAKKIAVVTGGYSGEAIISLQSAAEVMKHIDTDKYEAYKIVIKKEGWVYEENGNEWPIDKNDFTVKRGGTIIKFDCVFMALHGTPGEDGKLQGYFDMLGLPYTSCNTTVSALTFNKFLTNAVMAHYGVDVARSVMVRKGEMLTADDILSKVNLPCFIKPNEGGSSLGTTKVKSKEEIDAALKSAFNEGSTALVEELIEGTEITCGVARIGGQTKSLAITEIVAKNDFFDFDAKYKDKSTEEITPARISSELEKSCKQLSEEIYDILSCSGFVRIDYIIKKDKLFFLEINTIPGLTERSLVPQMAEYIGISRKELFSQAIESALSK